VSLPPGHRSAMLSVDDHGLVRSGQGWRVSATSATLHRSRHDHAHGVRALTRQERRMLEWVGQETTNTEIGHTVGHSETTGKHYLSHSFEKVAVSRRAQAAVLFIRQVELPSIDTARVRIA